MVLRGLKNYQKNLALVFLCLDPILNTVAVAILVTPLLHQTAHLFIKTLLGFHKNRMVYL